MSDGRERREREGGGEGGGKGRKGRGREGVREGKEWESLVKDWPVIKVSSDQLTCSV